MLSPINLLRYLSFLSLLSLQVTSQYTSLSRWGQASALVNDLLFIYAGKTDPYNQYSYTTAPNNNDLLKLSLSTSFNLTAPPWEYVGGSSNSSTSQGSPNAWSTLSAYNTSQLLSFGGQPGPNSLPPVATLPDSAEVLDIYNRLEPSWKSEPQAWASEPIRRIYHAASSTGGKIWITGGEKADGSNSALSDHVVFDPNVPSFTLLPTTNGPPDIYGHASIVLTNGSLIVFGGYSESLSSLVQLSTIWMLDTTSDTLEWVMLLVDATTLPSGRRGFAATLIEGGSVLIHGGCDATMQNVYSDGWILDTSKNPMVWTPVPQLSQLGPRRDHFAAAYGSSVVFGFGYGSSGPTSPDLSVYDCSSSSWSPSYTPPPSTSTITNTLPSPTHTTGSTGNSYTAGQPTGTDGSPTDTSGGVHPTSTSGNGGDGNGGGNGSGNPSGHLSRKQAIALGSVFGALTLVAGSLFAAYYWRRYQQQNASRFHMLGGMDDESPHAPGNIPIAGNVERGGSYFGFNGRGTVSHRRDMLADEDTRYFVPTREPSGSSFYSFGFNRPEKPSFMLGGSLASLRSVGAMLGMGAAARRSQEPSRSSRTSSWAEKATQDPFSDETLLFPGETVASRPKGGRTSSWSIPSYTDPFSDKDVEEYHDGDSDAHSINMEATLNEQPPTPFLHTPIPTSEIGALSPIMETVSHRSSGLLHSSDSDHNLISAIGTSSGSSEEGTRSSGARRSSIIDANPQPIRRSDSWWSKFAKTSFLDRRSSDGASSSRLVDFRDPNPAPRLGAIEETSPDSKPSRESSAKSYHNRIYSTIAHGRSVSSMKTAQTADSEALERIGAMDIVQRDGTIGSRFSTEDTGPDAALSVVTSADHDDNVSRDDGGISRVKVNLATPAPAAARPSGLPSPSGEKTVGTRPSPPRRPSSGGIVSSRVQAFERRTSADAEAITPPSPEELGTKNREIRTGRDRNHSGVKYGFAPKPSLFVANPDRNSPSSAS